MKQAVIEFTGHVTIYPDGDEYEGGELSATDAYFWLSGAMARGDKHASSYNTSARVVAVTYENYAPDEKH